MSIKVYCPDCGWIKATRVNVFNIEEGPQGEDLVSFECECGKTNTSKAIAVPVDPYDDE